MVDALEVGGQFQTDLLYYGATLFGYQLGGVEEGVAGEVLAVAGAPLFGLLGLSLHLLLGTAVVIKNAGLFLL